MVFDCPHRGVCGDCGEVDFEEVQCDFRILCVGYCDFDGGESFDGDADFAERVFGKCISGYFRLFDRHF